MQRLLPTWTLPILGIFAVAARLVYNKYGYGISSVPGPFLAAWTDLWRFFIAWGRHAEQTHVRLHEKYGPLVRLGPNSVSISDPGAVKVIYGLTSGYVKVFSSS